MSWIADDEKSTHVSLELDSTFWTRVTQHRRTAWKRLGSDYVMDLQLPYFN